ncbi:MAG: BON domain-containing protein [Chloroflexi bacterium]|nr:BON domain-containing protein [Chloroflexota bacterium]
MNKLAGMLVLGAACLAGGCANTVGGAAKDAATDTAVVANSTKNAAAATQHAVANAGHEAHMGAKNTAGATVVTPEVKSAIVRDPVLNDRRNEINVNTRDGVVHLEGHVQTASMKARASEDAQAELTKHNRQDKVQNDLKVGGQ